MALDETEEAWPEMEEELFGEEQPDLPAGDGEVGIPSGDAQRSASLVEGELQKDGMDSAAAGDADEALGTVKRQDEWKDMPAYDPTSPAEDEDEDGQDSKAFARADADQHTATETAWPLERGAPAVDTTEAAWTASEMPPQRREAAAAQPRAEPRERKVIPCPVLLVGSQLTKECQLYPGRWVEVGRHAKAHVLMQNVAVSSRHCKLQWKRGSSTVELHVIDGITYVNDKRLNIGAAMSLKHGDLVKIHGKGVCFRLIVDMCPINQRLPNVRSMANYIAALKDTAQTVRTPEDELRRRIRKLRAAAAAARDDAMKYEERIIDFQTKRTRRVQKEEEELTKARWFEQDDLRLETMLEKSRDEWLERLQQQNETIEKAMRPINDLTIETQTKRDSLQIFKNVQDRTMHPERHMRSIEPMIAGGSPRKIAGGSPRKKSPAKPSAEADGEDQAFADAPARGIGLHDGEGKDEKLAFDKPTVEVLKTAPTGADDDIANLFGDFDSEEEDELEAKRQRLV